MSENGQIDRIQTKDREEANFIVDQNSNDGENWILLTQKEAEKMAYAILNH